MRKEARGDGVRTVGRPRLSQAAQANFASKIIDIARTLFFEEGFASVSMRKIAQRAGCSPMTIYYYFANKHAILQHIWVSIFDEIVGDLETAQAASDSPVEALRSISLEYIRYWLGHPEHFQIVYLTVDSKTSALGNAVLNAEGSSVRRLYELFETALERCVEARLLEGAPSAVMAQVLFTSIYGTLLCALTIPEYEWSPEQQLAEEVIANFFRGYRSPA